MTEKQPSKAPTIQYHNGPLDGEYPAQEGDERDRIVMGFESTSDPDIRRVIPYFPIGDLAEVNKLCGTPHVVAQYLALTNFAFYWNIKEWKEADEPKKPKKEKKPKPQAQPEAPKEEKSGEKKEKTAEGTGGFGKATALRTPEEEALLFAPKSSPVEDYIRETRGAEYLECWKRRFYRFQDYDMNPFPVEKIQIPSPPFPAIWLAIASMVAFSVLLLLFY